MSKQLTLKQLYDFAKANAGKRFDINSRAT